jgi:hypothetical protein
MLSNKYIKNKTIKIWGATSMLSLSLHTLGQKVETLRMRTRKDRKSGAVFYTFFCLFIVVLKK